MIVKINDKEVELRFTFNTFVEFEKHFNEPLQLDMTDLSVDKTLWFYYFMVLCSKKGWQTTAWLTKDEFDEWLNDEPERIIDLINFATENMNLQAILSNPDKKK